MRTFKSILTESEIDRERLLSDEDDCSEPDDEGNECGKVSCYECCRCKFCQTDEEAPDSGIIDDESLNSMRELPYCEDTALAREKYQNKESENIASYECVREKFEVYTKIPEMILPIKSHRQNFLPSYSNEEKIPALCWSLVLRYRRLAGLRLPAHCGRLWRPVSVRLEENTLKFYAEDFESSPPFRQISLTWFHSFRIPVKPHITRGGGEYHFTTVLVNSLHSTRGRLARRGKRWKPDGSRDEVKLGCANHDVLVDFMETVQKCISSFPGFRQQGIRYKMEKVLVRVQDAYQVTQQERGEITVKQMRVMVKAKVSASPECSLHVKYTQSFSEKSAINDVSFHKCVQSQTSHNQTVSSVTARFLPLDNCWFQLMSWKSCSSRPPPLRGEVTVAICGYNTIQLCARIFTASTRVEVTSARDVTLRFCIPSEWLETERKPAYQTIQHCTEVTKGNVSYNSKAETLLWCIPKLSFKPCRNYFLTGNPIASLRTQFEYPSCLNAKELAVNIPVEMDFSMKGNTRSSEVEITSLKLGLKNYGKHKIGYDSTYRIEIPVTCKVV